MSPRRDPKESHCGHWAAVIRQQGLGPGSVLSAWPAPPHGTGKATPLRGGTVMGSALQTGRPLCSQQNSAQNSFRFFPDGSWLSRALLPIPSGRWPHLATRSEWVTLEGALAWAVPRALRVTVQCGQGQALFGAHVWSQGELASSGFGCLSCEWLSPPSKCQFLVGGKSPGQRSLEKARLLWSRNREILGDVHPRGRGASVSGVATVRQGMCRHAPALRADRAGGPSSLSPPPPPSFPAQLSRQPPPAEEG